MNKYVSLVLFLSLLMAGCDDETIRKTESSKPTSNVWINDGNGVWHVACTSEEFPGTVAQLKKANPTLKIGAINYTAPWGIKQYDHPQATGIGTVIANEQ